MRKSPNKNADEIIQIRLSGPTFAAFLDTAADPREWVGSAIREWGMVIACPPQDGWQYLVYIHEEEPAGFDREKRGNLIDRAGAKLRAGRKLPKHFYLINRTVAICIYTEGVKAFGLSWFDAPETDRFRYSNVIQMALFGEIRYA